MSGNVSGQPGSETPGTTPAGQGIQPGAAQEQQTTEPKPITREEVAAIALRTAQSLTDKASNRIKTDLDNLRKSFEIQREAGIQITPEQQLAAENAVIVKAQQASSGQQTQDESDTGSSATVPNDPMKYLDDQLKAAGISIEPGDPEAEILKGSAGPYDWGLKVAEAIAKKKARLNLQTNQAAARIPTGGGAQPGKAPAKSARELWERAHQ